MPIKTILRVLSAYSLVVLVNEHGTSKYCPLDFKELFDSGEVKGDRVRVCPTSLGGASHITADRDAIGGTNICQKGVYQLLGRKLEAFYREQNV